MAKLLSSLKSRLGLSKPLLGLDIGADSIKAVELRPAGNAMRVVRAAIAPIHGGPRGEQNPDDVGKALARLLRENHFGTRRVATAVSGEAVIVRVLRLPAMKNAAPNEVRMAIQSEAQDFIPFDMEEVLFDYQLLGNSGTQDATVNEALIVAVRKDVVERLLALLDEAGLETEIIDVSSFALCNALAYGGAYAKDEVIALVSIGAATTSIAILRNGMTRFTRDLTVAGRAITAAIANELGVPFAEAEQLKTRYGIVMDAPGETGGFELPEPDGFGEPSLSHDPLEELYVDSLPAEDDAAGSGIGTVDALSIYGDIAEEPIASAPPPTAPPPRTEPDQRERDAVAEICAHYLNEITGEIKRSFIYYENQLDGEPVSRVLLCGGTAQMPNATSYLSGLLDLPAERIPAIPRVDWGATGNTDVARSLFGVSVGLALRGTLE